MVDATLRDRSSSSSLSSLDSDPSKDPQLPPDVNPQAGQSSYFMLVKFDLNASSDAELSCTAERRSSTSSLTKLDPDSLNDSESPTDVSSPEERKSSSSSPSSLGPDPSQDLQYPTSPTYWDRDYSPEQIPPLRCRRAVLHQTWGAQGGQGSWYTMWGAYEYPAQFNVEDIIIAGGVTVVQKIVERDSIVAVKIAVHDPRGRDNNFFQVEYDADAKRYEVTFEVAGFSHYLHGKPRLRRGYTDPLIARERLPVARGPSAPLRPNAYDTSRTWVKSIGSSYNLNYAIRNFRSREFPIIFALHDQAKFMRLHFFEQDFVGREDGGDWCEHKDHIRHIEHLLLNKAHPKFLHDGDIFLKETFADSGSCAL